MNKQKGFTIVEIMIAAVIALILLNGVIQIFLSSKQTYRFGEAVSRLQESGRFAMDILAREIRMAGYQGCADFSSIPATVIANNPPSNAFQDDSLHGWEVTASGYEPSTPAQTSDVTAAAKQYSDIIVVFHAADLGVQLTGNMDADNANIQIGSNSPGFVANDLIVISDCETADIFRATNVSTDTGTGKVTMAHSNVANTSNKLSKAYGINSKVYSFEHNAFFVGDTGRTNSRGQKIYALYRRDVKGNVTELVEGVENMQILYGEKADSGTIRYVPANNGTLDMKKVVSVRIALLLHSVEPVNSTVDNATYNVAGTSITPEGTGTVTHGKDKRIRRVFTSTIKIRNRR